MELTLNLVWVCVAIAAVLAQIATFSHNAALARQPAGYSRKIIAMGCALVILFFVISMTDDLHDQQVLIEERKASRIVSGMETTAHPGSARCIPIDFLLFFPPASFSLSLPAGRRGIEPSEFLFAATIDPESLCSRAPPVSHT